MVKTIEIHKTKADQLAPGKGPSDAVREIPVAYVKEQLAPAPGRDAVER